MSGTLVGILGFACIVAIVVTLFKSKTLPSIAFIVFPMILALVLVLGKYYTWEDIASLIKSGFSSTGPTAALFVFSVLYFGIMTDAGMFDVIIGKLMLLVKDSVVGVCIMTCIIALIGHLDGAYNTTYLIAIPALAPLYKRLNIDRRSLVLLVSLAAAPMTAMAWGQPAKMTVFDPSIDPVVMASSLYPVVAIMLGLAVVTSLGFGYYYSKKNASEIALLRKSFENGGGSQKVDFSDNPLARPKLFWANFALFLGSLACFMFMTGVKTYVLFMVFSCAALLLNYHTQKEQSQIIRKHSATMLAPAILFLGIGIMVGILNGTGMVTAMVDAVLGIVPESMARWTHVLYAILILPLEIFIPYQAFQSMNPLLLGIGAGCGLTGYQVLTCMNISYLNPCSPLVAAANLACELAEVDIIKQVKFSVLFCLAFNTIGVLICVALGLA